MVKKILMPEHGDLVRTAYAISRRSLVKKQDFYEFDEQSGQKIISFKAVHEVK